MFGRRETAPLGEEAEMADLNDAEQGEKKQEETKHVSSGRLIALAKDEKWLLFAATLSLAVTSAAQMAIPAILGLMLSALDENGSKEDLNRVTLLMMAVFVILGIGTALRASLFHLAGERIVSKLRKKIFANVIRQEIGFFDLNRTGEIIDRITVDVAVVQSAVTVNISMALRFIVQAIGGIFILFFISWKLTLIMLSVVPIVATGTMKYGKYVRKLSKQTQDSLAQATAIAEEVIGNIRTTRSFSKESKEESRYADQINATYQLAAYQYIASGAFQGGATVAVNFALILVLWYGGNLVLKGDMSLATLGAFVLYTVFTSVSLAFLSALYTDMMKAIGASQRVFELIDRQPSMENCTNGGYTPSDCEGLIVMDNVSFSYPSRGNVSVLKELNLKITPGKVVALVGPSGGGKSTIAQLIQRFYDPKEGLITLDGRPLNELNPHWLRSQIAVVSQEPVLFATSIRNNIAYALENPDGVADREIEDAARKANALEFISKFPDGFKTMVGERGVRLSGGQKQRVAIARALLKDPRILLLDEATSALDSESEHLVQEALERLMSGRTVLVIAHRLSTVMSADQIAVVEDGQIVELGTHQQLIAKNGAYHKLVNRQLGEGTSPRNAREPSGFQPASLQFD